jgi:uncharacterized protein
MAGQRRRGAHRREVDTIEQIVKELLTGNVKWRDKEGEEHIVGESEMLIVAPYNAHVIYSMTSSSPEDAPRGMEFLYNPNRFNVATSRSRALCVLVGSSALFEPECKTPRQMRMANGFCRYIELASEK